MALDFRYPSPDGRYGFRISSWEARMSHWIESAELIEVASGWAGTKGTPDAQKPSARVALLT